MLPVIASVPILLWATLSVFTPLVALVADVTAVVSLFTVLVYCREATDVTVPVVAVKVIPVLVVAAVTPVIFAVMVVARFWNVLLSSPELAV
jgi:hypothetical protein